MRRTVGGRQRDAAACRAVTPVGPAYRPGSVAWIRIGAVVASGLTVTLTTVAVAMVVVVQQPEAGALKTAVGRQQRWDSTAPEQGHAGKEWPMTAATMSVPTSARISVASPSIEPQPLRGVNDTPAAAVLDMAAVDPRDVTAVGSTSADLRKPPPHCIRSKRTVPSPGTSWPSTGRSPVTTVAILG